MASVGLLMGTGVAAWACTPQPRSFAVTPGAAAAGSAAKVVGQGVPAGSSVEVRWDDLRGQIIGATTADSRGQFQASVTIPQGQPGVHTVIFSAGEPSKATSGVGRLTFNVQPAGSEAARAVDPWSSAAGSTGRSGSGGSNLPLGLGIAGAGMAALGGGSVLVAAGRRRRAGSS
jgi:hypothetical protein